MLVRLFGKNFRSLRDPFELSLVAADLKRKEDRDRGVIEARIQGLDEPLQLLRVAAIFGANASGKSTVLLAARALNWLVTRSSVETMPERPIPPYEPFLLDEASSAAAVELGCEVVCEERLVRYEVVFHQRRIERETLVARDGDGEETLFERPAEGEIGGSLIAGSEENRLYVREMQPNVTVLAKLAQHGPGRGKHSVQSFYKATRDATQHEDYLDAAATRIELGDARNARFADDLEYRAWIIEHLIQPADVGISGVQARREKFHLPEEVRRQLEGLPGGGFKAPDSRVVVAFMHAGALPRALNLNAESSGTKKLFNLAQDWWRLAHEERTLFADEMSASLHPRLLDRLVRAINEPPQEYRAQLIFATHDAGLLESRDGKPPALRRDQVYFTEKNDEGATELYALAEFKDEAREVHNLRKRYLSGQYGAVPDVEDVSL